MEYGSIPEVDRPVARLVLGSMHLGDHDMEALRKLLDAYIEAGGNAVDSARIYRGGGTERGLGQYMRERGCREELTLIGKGGHPGPDGPRLRPEDLDDDLAVSLDRLGVETIDIYLLHRDDPSIPAGELIDYLNRKKSEGLIGAFGGSNWTSARIEEANAYAAANGLEGFVVSSPQLSLAKAKEPRWPGCVSVTSSEELAWYERTQMCLLSWSSQAGGFFTGRFARGAVNDPEMARVYDSPENWERLDRAQRLARGRGASANEIALAWVLRQPFPTFAVIGPQNAQELHASAKALEVALTPEEAAWLDLAGPPPQGLGPGA